MTLSDASDKDSLKPQDPESSGPLAALAESVRENVLPAVVDTQAPLPLPPPRTVARRGFRLLLTFLIAALLFIAAYYAFHIFRSLLWPAVRVQLARL